MPALLCGSPIEVGTILDGRYQIESVLGAGGMGVVLRAKHLALRQTVAIKVPLLGVAAESHTVERLLREARAAVRLRSEHVCRVLDVGSTPTGLPYIVLEHLDGVVLSSYLRRKKTLSIAQTWRFLLETCEAVGEAHRLGIVHRDLKPANLFLVADSLGRRSIKVLDFGISKVDNPDIADARLTESATLMGSPSYIAPEQMSDTRSVDARADVWALGVCAYEIVTGELPFKGASVMDLAVRIANDDVVPPSRLRDDLPPALDAIILRCLAKRREDRFDSAVELGAALADAAPPSIAHGFVRDEVGSVSSLLAAAAEPHSSDGEGSLGATSATVTAAAYVPLPAAIVLASTVLEAPPARATREAHVGPLRSQDVRAARAAHDDAASSPLPLHLTPPPSSSWRLVVVGIALAAVGVAAFAGLTRTPVPEPALQPSQPAVAGGSPSGDAPVTLVTAATAVRPATSSIASARRAPSTHPPASSAGRTPPARPPSASETDDGIPRSR